MKTPRKIIELSISDDDLPKGPYPSLGFVPIYDAELGNGDYYGLYWPLGMENKEPFVCDMHHDEWRLELCFSSVKIFLEWLGINDWERGEEEIDDLEHPKYLAMQAKQKASQGCVDKAIELLQKSCANFPELSENWFTLSSQLKRVGNVEKGAEATLKAFHSNWVFGMPPQGVTRSLNSPQFKEILAEDPLIARMNELKFTYGGTKENYDYQIYLECIDEYFKKGMYMSGLYLLQNYGYMMYSETISFQERYNFDLSSWQKRYSSLCLEYLGDNRVFSVI
jgi:hypothetical protein